LWCEALGAEMADMTGHQGHGSVAHPAGILVSWAVIMEGGFQLDATGERFWDESQGYSEAALAVLARPGGVAFDVFDERIASVARQFEDFRQAEASGAVLSADSPAALDAALRLPAGSTARALAERQGLDRFGRDWRAAPPLVAPFRAVRVTGALFHTQGGPRVGRDARVLRPGGVPIPGLFAAGGAARGVSGPEASGYLSGNGLVTAVVLGRLAGRAAALSQRNDG
jgi:fumarate reductase flavoprotein subunit